MKTVSISMWTIMFFLSCTAFTCNNADETTTTVVLDGTYGGDFFRRNHNADYRISDVTINFRNGRFDGSSSVVKYPAICRGAYDIKGDTVTFRDECIWTAEFDWSLILSGEYTINQRGEEIEMLRKYDDNITDVYRLKRTRK